MENKQKKIFSLYMGGELYHVVEELCRRETRNRNLQIEYMLKQYLKDHKPGLYKKVIDVS